jgi:hypothetical protein
MGTRFNLDFARAILFVDYLLGRGCSPQRSLSGATGEVDALMQALQDNKIRPIEIMMARPYVQQK